MSRRDNRRDRLGPSMAREHPGWMTVQLHPSLLASSLELEQWLGQVTVADAVGHCLAEGGLPGQEL